MRVAFNARVLSDPVLRGWNRYTLNLISELAGLGVTVFLYTYRGFGASQFSQLPLHCITLRQAPSMNYFWEQYWIPRQCLRDRIAVFHSPVHFGLPQMTRSKCVLTLHPAIDGIYYSERLKSKSLAQRTTALLSRMARSRTDHNLNCQQTLPARFDPAFQNSGRQNISGLRGGGSGFSLRHPGCGTRTGERKIPSTGAIFVLRGIA